jgi:hypothetical protein
MLRYEEALLLVLVIALIVWLKLPILFITKLASPCRRHALQSADSQWQTPRCTS